MRVILADKDPYDLEALRSELASPGIEVRTAPDGREVLRMVREWRPDAVVVAASLGQMGGFAVSRELKTQAALPGADPAPRVYVLLEREADAWLARWSRCDGWLTKPVTAEQVRALLETEAAGTATP